MEKRYQVFISSTFADLEEERKGIMEAIIELDCFPAGMEMFPATDTEQFEYIKSIIDESDYYVLVIAGRYGSLAEDGISYTEKEFDYAKEKGIPILAFVKKDIESIPANKTDQDPKKKRKLTSFRNKALKGRVGHFWDNANDLKYKIHSSLSKEFKTHPRSGWIKGNDCDVNELMKQINQLKCENYRLKKKIPLVDNQELNVEQFKDKFIIDYNVWDDEEEILGEENFEIQTSLYEIVTWCGKDLIHRIESYTFKRLLNDNVVNVKANDGEIEKVECSITDDSLKDIELRLMAFGIIDTYVDSKKNETLWLTPFGRKLLFYTIKNEDFYWLKEDKTEFK